MRLLVFFWLFLEQIELLFTDRLVVLVYLLRHSSQVAVAWGQLARRRIRQTTRAGQVSQLRMGIKRRAAGREVTLENLLPQEHVGKPTGPADQGRTTEAAPELPLLLFLEQTHLSSLPPVAAPAWPVSGAPRRLRARCPGWLSGFAVRLVFLAR